MLNAKETLKKLADALSITSEETAKEEETVETTKEEVISEPVEETVETENEATEAPKEEETVEETEEKAEEPKEEVAPEAEEPKDDKRVQELEDKVKELTEILKNALSEPEAPKVPDVPEDTKGLTHSPEAHVNKKHTKLGDKGDNVMSRVYKYINH